MSQPACRRLLWWGKAALEESNSQVMMKLQTPSQQPGATNMTNALIAVSSHKALLPTVLGQGVLRIPTAGKIRAGIMVLTKAAANNAKAKQIYERGVNAHLPFEDIEKEINAAVPELRNPLTPKNVPWFTVRPADFPNPEIARQIMEAFGEKHGDGERRLYKFPVVWPADAWQAVMPHELVAWGASEKKYWSEYSPDGQVRYCRCYAPVAKDQSGTRAIRVFGGRKTMLRTENNGVCNPENCAEYQNRQCNLSGRFVFYIPGIKSIDAIELHTNSFYAMNAAIQKFQTIAFMRGGRISGFLDGNQTPFYITKKLMNVPHIDSEGKAVRVKHWIIEMQAPVDVSALLRGKDDEETAIVNAGRAAQILETGGQVYDTNGQVSEEPGNGHDSPGRTFDNALAAENATERVAEADVTVAATKAAQEPQTAQTATAGANTRTSARFEVVPNVEDILTLAETLGIERVRFDKYSVKKWGAGWKGNANGRTRVMRDVESYRDNPEGLSNKVSAELDVFA